MDIYALALYRSTLCPCGCGFPVAETTSHEETGPQFEVSRVRCRARDALLLAQAFRADRPGALLWHVERR